MYFHSKTKLRKAGILFSSFIFLIFFFDTVFFKKSYKHSTFIYCINISWKVTFLPLITRKTFKNLDQIWQFFK